MQIFPLVKSSLHLSKVTKKNNSIYIGIGSLEDLKKFMQISSKHSLTYSVISQGKNWGYKNKDADTIVVSLRKLNKILRYDDTFGVMVIEPGVTFRQAYEFLKKKKSQFHITATGGPSSGSIIATIAQRGIGRGIYGNMYDYCTNLETMLPDGSIVNTGFGKYRETPLKDIAKYPSGPIETGLYTQSSLGIIVKASILLAPIFSYMAFYSFTMPSDKKLSQFIDKVRELKMKGYMRGNFIVGNIYRFLTHETQYPWEKMKGNTPLKHEVLLMLAQQYGLKGEWMGEQVIEADTLEEINIQKQLLLNEFRDILDTFQFIDSEDIRRLKSIRRRVPPLTREKINNIIYTFEHSLFKGVPNDTALKSLYWRKKTIIPDDINPERDRCGVIWFNSVLPLNGKEVIRIVNKIKKVMIICKFEPNIGFNFVSDRILYLIGVILFDKSDPLEEKNAEVCFKKIMKLLEHNGYYPYRTAQ